MVQKQFFKILRDSKNNQEIWKINLIISNFTQTTSTTCQKNFLKIIFPGHYCLPETRHPKQHPCPAGSWSNSTNLQKWSDCTECPKGFYCLEGSSQPSGICPTGHYCPPGIVRVFFYMKLF